MSILRSGSGIVIKKYKEWHNDEEIEIEEISLDITKPQENMFYSPPQFDWNNPANIAQPGDILMINECGGIEWRKPFDSDKELREKYPVLQDSWNTLMEALNEYELAKKLVSDEKES